MESNNSISAAQLSKQSAPSLLTLEHEALHDGVVEQLPRRLMLQGIPFLVLGSVAVRHHLKVRRAFEVFLSSQGYTVAPVTVDNDEFVYATAYARALRRGNTADAVRIADDYPRYMEQVFTLRMSRGA